MVILEPGESGARLPRSDRRWEHLRKVLHKKAGDRVSAGLAVDAPFGPAPGAVGEAALRELDESGLVLDYEGFAGAAGEPAELAPLVLVLGMPRPIQANRILKDLASLGLAEIRFVRTELGEKSYAESDFYRERRFRSPLIEGAEQAANPRLPRVSTHWSLERCLGGLGGAARILLHPYGGAPLLGSLGRLEPPLVLAVGSERGWTEAELAALRDGGFAPASLGGRILKTETAALAACSMALGKLGLM
ncbi:MAG TPA: RsmE family RNA methyltransferase [Spirochaetales bacterium]|nr:RsmE family RNA methyltransferase [Spirochaetales bacterium]HRY53999.1 RsmE family RNA methyltransferase [Spirochaetia bacterium]HRZ63693.1 RsmE family RNA methyltransferase [Spirochaetia bacterium]